MEEIICKRCGSTHYVKWKIRGSQGKCLIVGITLRGDNRGRIHPSLKALILLYGSGKASYGMIAFIKCESNSSILYVQLVQSY